MQVYLCDERARSAPRSRRHTHAPERAAPSVAGRESNSACKSCHIVELVYLCDNMAVAPSEAGRKCPPFWWFGAGWVVREPEPQKGWACLGVVHLAYASQHALHVGGVERRKGVRRGVLSRRGCGAPWVVMGSRHSPGTSARATPRPGREFGWMRIRGLGSNKKKRRFQVTSLRRHKNTTGSRKQPPLDERVTV